MNKLVLKIISSIDLVIQLKSSLIKLNLYQDEQFLLNLYYLVMKSTLLKFQGKNSHIPLYHKKAEDTSLNNLDLQTLIYVHQ